MKVYLVKSKKTGKFVGKSKYSPEADTVEKARIFKRKSDITQSVIHSQLYDILAYELCPVQSEQIRHKYVITSAFYRTNNFPLFNSEAEAEAFLVDSKTGLHKDYFQIRPLIINDNKRHSIPTWQDYFLGLAVVVSKRSKDVHTKHGCIIVDGATNQILGTGYNSFPRKMRDSELPLNRPTDPNNKKDFNASKYPWMVHSEPNAVSNMIVKANQNTIAYVTGEPCFPCLVHMWQNGITQVIHRKAYGSINLIDDQTRENTQTLLAHTGMKVIAVEADLSWLSQLV